MERRDARDAVAAGLVAAAVSGAPSTVHALATGRDPLEPTLAAGSILLPRERRRLPLVAAAVPVHLAISLGWALVLTAVLPRCRTTTAGAAAGLAIAALDLGVLARLFPRVRALPQVPQWLDHALYGATVGCVLAKRRSKLHSMRGRRRVPAAPMTLAGWTRGRCGSGSRSASPWSARWRT